MPQLPVYLDCNATTPCDPRVVEAMMPYFHDRFGNAASHTHAYGWAAKEAVDLAREQVARLVGAEPGEIIFTSGATEAINLALKGVFGWYRRKGNHIITCETEHKAVLDTCKSLEKQGARITYLPVHPDGSIDLDDLSEAITDKTLLVALMFANNETGYLHPVAEIGRKAHEKGCFFFCDATQAVGKIALDVNATGIDLMAFSGHKMYAPKGVGALFLRRKNPRVRVEAQMDGGGHENGFRSGTLNVPGIVGFGEASRLCILEMERDQRRLLVYRNHLEEQLLQMDDVGVNGCRDRRLAHTSNLAFGGISGQALLTEVSKKLAVAAGSACTSALPEPSHVLMAMGLSKSQAQSSLRFSLGRFTTEQDILIALETLKNALDIIRQSDLFP